MTKDALRLSNHAPRSHYSLRCLHRPGSPRVPRPFSPPGPGRSASRNRPTEQSLSEHRQSDQANAEDVRKGRKTRATRLSRFRSLRLTVRSAHRSTVRGVRFAHASLPLAERSARQRTSGESPSGNGLAGRLTSFVSRAHARSARVDAGTEQTPKAFARVERRLGVSRPSQTLSALAQSRRPRERSERGLGRRTK